MDTQLLKTFLEVYRTRHFGQAAHNLHLSQSAVSARIRLLEEQLGLALFTRDRNNIQLTTAGQKLLRHAESITTAWGQARRELATDQNAPEPLSVAAVASLWDSALQDWVHRVYGEYPGVSLVADVLGAETLLRELLAGNLDLGFLFDAPQSPELMVAEAMPVSLIMVSSRPGLTPGQAVATDYVMVDWGTAFTIAHARRFRDMPAPRARVGLGRMAQALLLARGGTAYLAEAMVRSELANGQLHRVADAPVIQRVAYAVYTVNSRRRDCIEQILGYFAPGLLPSG